MNFKTENSMNFEAYRKLKSLLRQLRGGGYSFVVSASGKNNCDVRVLSEDFCGIQQHVISMQCQNLSVKQAQTLVSQYI